jgi:hypothetical protein
VLAALRTKVPGLADLQPYRPAPGIADPGYMAQRNNRLLLTTGLARMEGENVMYTRASDNSLCFMQKFALCKEPAVVAGRSPAPIARAGPKGLHSRIGFA